MISPDSNYYFYCACYNNLLDNVRQEYFKELKMKKLLFAVMATMVLLTGCKTTTSEPDLYANQEPQLPTAGSDAAHAAHTMY